MSIVFRIKQLMSEKNITVTDLAKKLHRSRQNMYDIFNEKQRISTKLLEEIAQVFNVPVTYFYDENTDQVKEPRVEYDHEDLRLITESVLRVLMEENKQLNRKIWELEKELQRLDPGRKN